MLRPLGYGRDFWYVSAMSQYLSRRDGLYLNLVPPRGALKGMRMWDGKL